MANAGRHIILRVASLLEMLLRSSSMRSSSGSVAAATAQQHYSYRLMRLRLIHPYM